MPAQPNDKTSLASEFRPWALALTSVIFAALVCNILALIYPFLEFSAAFQGREFYSIPLTISLMWNFGLYAAAILIVAFSLIFPFVKLALLLMTLWMPMLPIHRERTLGALRHLGRWSLLDVYIVLTILVLADDQIFIGAVPRVGVTLFLIAICSSMATAEFIHGLNGEFSSATTEKAKPGRKRSAYWASPKVFWPMLALLPLATVSLLAAIGLPFFHISQFMLRHKAYSIVNSITALMESGFLALALPMMAFLVILPVAKLASMAFVGFVPLHENTQKRARIASSVLGAWSMLDVFALSLLLFLIEGDRLIGFQVRSGLYVIILSVCVYYLALLVDSQLPRSKTATGSDQKAD